MVISPFVLALLVFSSIQCLWKTSILVSAELRSKRTYLHFGLFNRVVRRPQEAELWSGVGSGRGLLGDVALTSVLVSALRTSVTPLPFGSIPSPCLEGHPLLEVLGCNHPALLLGRICKREHFYFPRIGSFRSVSHRLTSATAAWLELGRASAYLPSCQL